MGKSKYSQEYLDKIIGIDNLSRSVFYDEKYLEKDWLIHFMYEIRTGEIVLTKQGLELLKDFWSFREIARILFDYEHGEGDFNISFGTREKLVDWLNHYHVIG